MADTCVILNKKLKWLKALVHKKRYGLRAIALLRRGVAFKRCTSVALLKALVHKERYG